MISFTDKRLYVKGICNVILENPDTQDIYYQSNKFSTGNVNMSTNLNEIRAGLGNAIVAMIPSDSQLSVEFTAADFNLWAKTAQFGGTVSYGAPSPVCQTVTADGTTLTVDISELTPVAQIGHSTPVAYIQKVGQQSLVASDGTAYEIDPATGAINGFTAESGVEYKVWFFVQKSSGQVAVVSSLIDPIVARMTAQLAVFANSGNANNQGSRVGWLYVVVPNLKLQGDGGITGDQTTADTTSISGQAIAYDESTVSATCSDCDASTLAYYIYIPDDEADAVAGLTVFGGVTTVETGSSVQIPVRFVMANGSTVKPSNYETGFTYELSEGAPAGTTVSTSGVVTAGSTAGEADVTITYGDYKNVSVVSIVASSDSGDDDGE